jgi:beta-glucosidase
MSDALEGGSHTVRFPDNFLWGAATSSHQVEGDNRNNDWWAAELAGQVPFRSGEACRHFTMFGSDFDLARSLGHNAHRFSLEWSRIEPRQGHFDAAAIHHYRQVIEALRARGLEPVVTLHHFTNPAWFAQSGGWLRRDCIRLFARYADHVAENLGGPVRYWLTLNEPTVYIKQAYILGNWPPCERNAWRNAWRVLRNQCRAHVAAYEALRRHRPGSMVGFAHSAPVVVPCDPDRPLDRLAAAVRDFVLNEACFAFMKTDKRRPFDFIGLNYYTRTVVRWQPRGIAAVFGTECLEDHHEGTRRFNDIGWEIYPKGLTLALQRFSRYGLPLLITENGIATDNEDVRRDFLRAHLEALAQAVALGIDVRGYFYWTLMDNFEWSCGTAPRFGLAAVDFGSQARTPRSVARDFAAVCRANELVLPHEPPAPRATAGVPRVSAA